MMNLRMMTTAASASCGLCSCRGRKLKTVAIGCLTLSLFALMCWIIIRAKRLRSVRPVQPNYSTDFQIVESGSGFVYSAYIDDRPARDVTSKADDGGVIRIFVYFMRTIDVQRKWKCLLWSDDEEEEPSAAPIITVTDLNSMARLRFMVAMVICSIPPENQSRRLAVRAVSLVSSDSNQTNLVGVVDLRRSKSTLHVLTGSAVVLQSNVTAFTVCTSPIHGNYYNASDIVNFIEVGRIFGAQRFVFYFDEDVDESVRDCLEWYRDRGIVEMYPFTPPVLDGLHNHGQILSITECVYRTMYRTKYLINQDIDEVIVPVNVNDWPTMLNAIHKRREAKSVEQIASYSFQNQFFPVEAPDDQTFNESFLIKRYNIKTLLKTMKEAYVFPHNERSKVMARPDRILVWHVHLILPENVIHANNTMCDVSTNDAILHHYRSWPTKRKLKRDQRMHRNASLITERVHSAMGFCSKID